MNMLFTNAIANVNISSTFYSRKSVRLAREIVELSILKQLDSCSCSSSGGLISSTVEACLMLKRVESAEKNYPLYFEAIVDMAKSLSNSLSIQNGRETFREISRHLFNNNARQSLISWGRVVAMNIFTIVVLKTLRDDNKLTLEFQNSIADWLGECLVEINYWMERQHVTRDGWISFVEESERHELLQQESTILSVFSYYTNEAVKTSFNVCLYFLINGC